MIRIDETLDELVAARRGYKYLGADGVSPYQGYRYDLASRGVIEADLDADRDQECGAGWNLATIRWIMDNCMQLDGVIVEFLIPGDATICVPISSDGKFRANKVCIVSVTPVTDVFPALRGLKERLATYQPVNPITATVMPDVNLIRRSMASVRASVWASVRASVRASVGASVGASVWDSVRASVWDYSAICGYYAMAKFLSLDYHHPVFDLIDAGVMVIPVDDEYLVFGKDGILLGRAGKDD